MKRSSIIVGIISLLVSALPSAAGELLDRIVAKVNGHAILQSDWEDAIRFEAFVDGRLPGQLGAAEAKAALNRLIDQELLREQMRSSEFQIATKAEVAARVEEIRKRYPEASSESGWLNLLSRFGLTDGELNSRLAAQLDTMRLIDAHLRPAVNIDSQSIESYYTQQLLPQLLQSGKRPVPLADVMPTIKELLTQKKMDQLLVAWLQNLHAASEIYIDPPAAASGRQVQ
jgi:hypothetical protein